MFTLLPDVIKLNPDPILLIDHIDRSERIVPAYMKYKIPAAIWVSFFIKAASETVFNGKKILIIMNMEYVPMSCTC